MTTKPTENTEWATDAGSLKIEPTPRHRTQGWTTSDDTINGVPEKPTLQHQNGWNYNAHLWAKWIQDNFPNTSGDYAFEDLWKWDTLGILNNGFTFPFVTAVTFSGSGSKYLDFYRDTFANPGNGFWSSYQASCGFGSMFFEFYDMMGRGLAIKLFDNSSQEWVIYSDSKGLQENPVEPLATISGNQTSNLAAERVLNFRINADSPDIKITRNGIPVTNFSTFSSISDSATWILRNPNGIRVGRYHATGDIGKSQFNSTINSINLFSRPTRRWIKPVANPYVDTGFGPDDTSPEPVFLMDLEGGKRYEWVIDLNFTSNPSAGSVDLYASLENDIAIGRSYNNTAANFQKWSGIITYPISVQAVDDPAFDFFGGFGAAINKGGLSGDISTVYDYSNLRGNMLIVSEVD